MQTPTRDEIITNPFDKHHENLYTKLEQEAKRLWIDKTNRHMRVLEITQPEYKREQNTVNVESHAWFRPITREEMIKAIYDEIWEVRNFWNPVEWDMLVEVVMIGDVLDYFGKKQRITLEEFTGWYKIKDWILPILLIDREFPRKPIQDQSLECIKYIYNLIKK